jgi:methylthioribose-1-phosphate isomerase
MRAYFCERRMRTIAWDSETNRLRLIDQRLLPGELRFLELEDHRQVSSAIRNMAVRGAPAIGAAAAFGVALAAINAPARSDEDLWAALQAAAEELKRARPTAVNLGWATERMLATAREVLPQGKAALQRRLIQEARAIAEEDVTTNRQIGANGAALLPQDCTVIHHCNTGALAAVDYGTALGVIRCAHESGKHVHVLVGETRPRLQGARLTAWELSRYGIPYEIITDSAAGYYLYRGSVAAVLVGADRVAANGDVANKIGTYMLALAAYDCGVPFYCAAPTSTVDLNLPSGEEIQIEERDPAEVLDLQQGGRAVAPDGSRARNPAFDITPHRLVSAFITEGGVIRPPFEAGLRSAVEGSRER